jgi:creatinine amidohydrolase
MTGAGEDRAELAAHQSRAQNPDVHLRSLSLERHVYQSLLLVLSLQAPASQAKLSVHWAELSAGEFRDAIGRAQGTCLLPFGIMEKHGPHLPLGNDLLNVRYVATNAAQQEYAIIFPEYYFGQIFEAKHEPGTVAYSRGLQLQLLQETTDEMARNGCKKVIIVNGHGGNNSLLPFFAQSQLEAPHDYVVYVMGIMRAGPGEPQHKSDRSTDMHAGESETSVSMIARPDLVHLDRARQESGADQARLKGLPEGLYTGIWWYARFPNHYAGEGAVASRELGEFEARTWINGLVQSIRAVKADSQSLRLQNEFYERSKKPLETPQ